LRGFLASPAAMAQISVPMKEKALLIKTDQYPRNSPRLRWGQHAATRGARRTPSAALPSPWTPPIALTFQGCR
jgi:hypothetical protein